MAHWQRSFSSPSQSSYCPLSPSGSAAREHPLPLLPVSDGAAAIANQQSLESSVYKRNCHPSFSSPARVNPDPRACKNSPPCPILCYSVPDLERTSLQIDADKSLYFLFALQLRTEIEKH
ncbi:hypothetical protein AAC387_Pa07g3855 [Persea americana]